MKLGILLPQHEVTPQQMTTVAQEAEDAGLHSVWLAEHLMGRPTVDRPILDCWTGLAAVAIKTTRVTIGPLVTRVGMRPVPVLHAMARTLNDMALGRLVVGVGLGDRSVADEHASFGIPMKDLAARQDEAERLVDALRSDPIRTFVGGASARVISLAAKAGGWNFWGKPGEMAEPLGRLRQAHPSLPASWSGQWPGEQGLALLVEMGVDEAVIATGSANWRDRIAQLAGFGHYS